MKTAVITGGNAGLGLACAEEIARDHAWRVVLACRSPERAQAAVSSIQGRTGNQHVEAAALDLASLTSVRRFANDFAGTLDALVLNAGVQVVTGRTLTEDGFETTFAVNHLGHFLLANLLLPKIVDGGRIVFVSSDTHDPKNFTGMPAPQFDDPRTLSRGEDQPGETPGHAGRRRYTTSKLCNVYCTYEMHRRLEQRIPGRRVTVNAFDPGFMPATGLARDYGPVARFFMAFILPLVTLVMPNANRVSTSAQRLARLAIDPAYAGVSGVYVSRGKPTSSSVESRVERNAEQLWNVSADLTKLDASPLSA